MVATALAAAVLLTAPAPPSNIARIVVLDLVAEGESKSLAAELSELILSEVRAALPSAGVIGQSEIKAMLALEQQKMAIGCEDDTSCLAEIGGALGADHLLVGRLGKVGGLYLLNLKLIYAPGAVVKRHLVERVRDPEQLLEIVARMTSSLVRSPASSATAPPAALAAEPSPPWYSRWWVWGAAAVLVAGAGAGVWYVQSDSSDPGSSDRVDGSVNVDLGGL